jgi:hypothetical protein
MVEPAPASVVVATHGHCFDGMCSAALFVRLLRAELPQPLSIAYKACGYGPDQGGVDPAILTGEVNAILDFRYAVSPKLGWYFDHHATAFHGPGERADFDANGGKTKFYDPTYGSCSKLVADVSRDRFGIADTPIVSELVRWADIIDSARFPSAEMAVLRAEEPLWLMTVTENHGNDAFLARMVPRLVEEPLDAIARSADVQKLWLPLKDAHFAFVDIVKNKCRDMGSVVFVDLTGETLDVVGKFVTYALYPKSVYSVMVSRGRARCKVSVGYNPWSGALRRHDISALCKRFGGGGHAVVGAISLAPGDVDRAREIAEEIARELST